MRRDGGIDGPTKRHNVPILCYLSICNNSLKNQLMLEQQSLAMGSEVMTKI